MLQEHVHVSIEDSLRFNKSLYVEYNAIAKRDLILPQHILEFLKPWLRKKNDGDSLKIADLGAGNIQMATAIMRRLTSFSSTEVDCVHVDIDEECMVSANEHFFNFLNNSPWRGSASYVSECMSEFVNRVESDSYDLVFVIHALYYLPREKWINFFEKVLESLNYNGKCLCIMRSNTGDMYKIRSMLEKRTDLLMRDDTDLYAEDLEQAFTNEDIEYQSTHIEYHLDFRSPYYVLRGIEFLYRLKPYCLDVEELLAKRLLANLPFKENSFKLTVVDKMLSLSKEVTK